MNRKRPFLFILLLALIIALGGAAAIAPLEASAAVEPTTTMVVEVQYASASTVQTNFVVSKALGAPEMPEPPEPQLNLSHICRVDAGTIKFHFVLVHTPSGVTDHGEVYFLLDGVPHIAEFNPPQTGGTSHYEGTAPTTATEVVIDGGQVTIQTSNGPQTILLHNPGPHPVEGSCIPQGVTILSFEASCFPQSTPPGGLVEWETGEEVGLLGFNLYRSATEGQLGTQLNVEVIPAQAPGGGGSLYDFLDLTVDQGETYWYTLQAVGTAGDTELFEPDGVTIDCGQPSAISLTTLQTAPRSPMDGIGAAVAVSAIALVVLLLIAFGYRRQRSS